MSTQLIVVTVLGAWAVLALGTLVFLRRMMAARRLRDRQALDAGAKPDDAGATEFPVRGACTRAGFLQGGYSKNGINPRFWVERDAVRIRILRSWRLLWPDIKQVDARKTMTGMALIFQIEAGRRAFVVRFGEEGLARSALSRIPASVPLTEDAAILRDGNARAATPGLQRYRGPLR
jgi:hypothetical protein